MLATQFFCEEFRQDRARGRAVRGQRRRALSHQGRGARGREGARGPRQGRAAEGRGAGRALPRASGGGCRRPPLPAAACPARLAPIPRTGKPPGRPGSQGAGGAGPPLPPRPLPARPPAPLPRRPRGGGGPEAAVAAAAGHPHVTWSRRRAGRCCRLNEAGPVPRLPGRDGGRAGGRAGAAAAIGCGRAGRRDAAAGAGRGVAAGGRRTVPGPPPPPAPLPPAAAGPPRPAREYRGEWPGGGASAPSGARQGQASRGRPPEALPPPAPKMAPRLRARLCRRLPFNRAGAEASRPRQLQAAETAPPQRSAGPVEG